VLALRVRARCELGCDLQGWPVEVLSPEGLVAAGELRVDEGPDAEAELRPSAPLDPGEHDWRIALLGPVDDQVHYTPPLRLRVRTKAHETSMAVWGIGAPLAVGSVLRLRVGVRCAAGCDLSSEPVEVRDDADRLVCDARLGADPWPGTDALYVAEVGPIVPDDPGTYEWRAAFPADSLRLPHLDASAGFSFRVVPAPDHTVTVRVVDRETSAPLPSVMVFFDTYRTFTDRDGVARLELPAGTYSLMLRKQGYVAPAETVGVAGNLALQVRLHRPQEVHPDELEEWM